MARQTFTRWEAFRLRISSPAARRHQLREQELSDWQTVWRVLADVLTVMVFWAFILFCIILGGQQ